MQKLKKTRRKHTTKQKETEQQQKNSKNNIKTTEIQVLAGRFQVLAGRFLFCFMFSFGYVFLRDIFQVLAGRFLFCFMLFFVMFSLEFYMLLCLYMCFFDCKCKSLKRLGEHINIKHIQQTYKL